MLNPRGSEGSDPPDDARAYTTEDYVSDLDELREHLGLGADAVCSATRTGA